MNENIGMNQSLQGVGRPFAPQMEFKKIDGAMTFIMLLCGFLYAEWILAGWTGLGVTMFTATIVTVTWIYFRKRQVKQTKGSMVYLGLTTLYSMQFLFFDGQLLHSLGLLFLSIAYIYWVMISTGNGIDKMLSFYAAADLFNQAVIVPLFNFSGLFRGIGYGLKENKKGKEFFYVLTGVICFLPVMIIVTVLLSSADAAFSHLVSRLLNQIEISKIALHIVNFVLGVPIACYLYGLVYGNITCRNTSLINKENLENVSRRIQFAPRLTIYTALAIFNGIYLLFFISQASYLFSAFESILPEAMTYAEYARRGFFELCNVTGINLGLMIVTYIIIKRGQGNAPKALRVLIGMMSLFTVLLIVTALSKMFLYISAYGMTQLRIYTSLFMMLLLVTFLIVAIRQVKVFNAGKLIIIATIVTSLIFGYGNIDGTIAKYNIQRYEAGTLENLDYNTLYALSDAAIPHVYQLYQRTEDEVQKEKLLLVMLGYRQLHQQWIDTDEIYYVLSIQQYQQFNVQKWRADQIRQELAEARARQSGAR